MSSSVSSNKSSKRRPVRGNALLMSPGLDVGGNDDFAAIAVPNSPSAASTSSSLTSKRAAAALLFTSSASSSSQQALVTPPYQRRGQKESWWDGVVQSAKNSMSKVTTTAGTAAVDDNDINDDVSVYSSLQDQREDLDDDNYSQTSTTADRPHTARLKSTSNSDGGLFLPSTANSDGNSTTTREEDTIRQEAPFFYRLEDTDMEQQRRRLQHQNRVSIAAAQREHSMHPQYRAAYRARFQQLNELRPEEFRNSAYTLDGATEEDGLEQQQQRDGGSIVNTIEDDLALRIEHTNTDEEEALSYATGAQLSTTDASSLFFVQHGKVLRKLPKDKIRLMMDAQLEPGILSVEHSSRCGVGQPIEYDRAQRDENDARPDELIYVLTVDEGLYRRVVQEIVDSNTSMCGLHDCLNEDGKADIKMAVGILIIVLVLLFVNTVGERGK